MLRKFIDIEHLIHSIKTAIACIIGFLLTKFIGFAADQWIVITIIVVMCAQIYVGSVLQKAYLRFLGTAGGCVFAACALLIWGDSNVVIAATIGLSSFLFSYLATGRESLSYAGTLGAATTAIIMLGTQPTLLFALERFLEISIGILIATLVSQFILPIHARTHLRRSQAATLSQLKDYYNETMMTNHADADQIDYRELDESIVQSLLKQRQLAKESKQERLKGKFDPDHFMQSLYCEREILRCITFMHAALLRIQGAECFLANSSAMSLFNKAIATALETLVKGLEADEPENETVDIPTLTAIKETLEKNVQSLSREQFIYLDSFLFSADLLTQNLATLAKLYNVPVKN